MKKVLYILLGLIFFLFLALVSIPLIFKDTIKAKVDQALAEQIDAKVQFSPDKFSLSLIKNFPDFTISLGDFGIIGNGDFEGDTLMYLQEFRTVVDFMSVVASDKIHIKGIYLDQPKIHVIVLPNGKANYMISKSQTPENAPAKPDEPASKFSIGIDHWEIKQGQVIYDDRSLKILTQINNLNHDGSGDFTQDVVVVKTNTQIDALTFAFDTITYISNKQVKAKVDMELNMPTSTYTFKENSVSINDFMFGFDGKLELGQTDILYDIKYKTIETSFKNFLSLVPGIYTQSFQDLTTEGSLAFDGYLKGVQNAHSLPGFGLKLLVKDGKFQYPSLPTPVKNVQLDLIVDNPSGVLDSTAVHLKKLHLEMGSNPIDASFTSKGMKKIFFDAQILAKVNLAEMTQIFPVDQMVLKGLFSLNLKAKGMYDSTNSSFPVLDANMKLVDGYIKTAVVPEPLEKVQVAAQINNVTGNMADTRFIVDQFNMEMQGAPFFAKGVFSNLKDYTYDVFAKGKVDLEKMTKLFPLDGMTLKGMVEGELSTKGKMSLINAKKYDQLPTSGKMLFQNFSFFSKDLPQGFKMTKASMEFNPVFIKVPYLEGFLGKSDIRVQGTFSNYMAYVFRNETIKGNMNFSSNNFDVNEWMSPATDPSTNTKVASTDTAIVSVPKNIDFVMVSDLKKVKYDNMDIENMKGDIIVKNGIVKMSQVNFNCLDGAFLTNGMYDPSDVKHPLFDFDLNIKNMSISKAYATFNTIKAMAPIAQNMEGKFNTNFKIKGELGKDMLPNNNTLTGGGTVNIIDGVVKDLKVLQQIGSITKQKQSFSDIKLKDIKLKANVHDGRVFVEPFNFEANNIQFQMGGSQGLDKSLDYVMKVDVPAGAAGAAVSSAIQSITGKSYGAADKVKMTFSIKGIFGDPKVALTGTSLEGSQGNDVLKDAEKQVKEDVTKAVKEQADKYKKEAEDKAAQEQEKLKNEGQKKLEEEAKKLKEKYKLPF